MPWKKMLLRDAEVFARVDEQGEPRVQGGRVEIRYSAKAPKAYHAAARNLSPAPGAAVLPDSHCAAVDADGAPAGGNGSSGTSTRGGGRPAGKRGPGTDATPVKPGGEAVVVYADGACSGNPGPAGLGMLWIDGGQRVERSEYLGTGTNNIAELTAILRALERVNDLARPVVIHTDSQYAIGVLAQGWKAKANQELIAKIRELLRTRPNVRFVYVPGHSGVLLNERADALARQAVQDRRTAEVVYGNATPGLPVDRTST